MATPLHSLTDKGVKALGDGRHADGGGLYLYLKGSARSWVMRYTIGGKRKELGLGGYPQIVSIAARAKAVEIRQIRETGGDPKPVQVERKLAAKMTQDRNAPRGIGPAQVRGSYHANI